MKAQRWAFPPEWTLSAISRCRSWQHKLQAFDPRRASPFASEAVPARNLEGAFPFPEAYREHSIRKDDSIGFPVVRY